MSSPAFDIFVRQEQAKTKLSAEDQFDPEQEREEWLSYIDDLYRMVVVFLNDYIAAGQVSVTYRDATINEEYVGDYVVRQMLIVIGTKVIRLEPIGTFLIGSKGRVDVVGPVLRAQLMLVDSQVKNALEMVRVSTTINGEPGSLSSTKSRKPNWMWRLITRPPDRRIIELTQEAFFALLVEIGNA